MQAREHSGPTSQKGPNSLSINDGLDKHILADDGNRPMTLGTKKDRCDGVEIVDWGVEEKLDQLSTQSQRRD